MARAKKTCDGCGAAVSKIHFFKSWGLCYKCYPKARKLLHLPSNYPIELEIAQMKVREVATWFKKGKKLRKCSVSLPVCYAGKKVKVLVVGESDPTVKTSPDAQEGVQDERLGDDEYEWVDDEKEEGEGNEGL